MLVIVSGDLSIRLRIDGLHCEDCASSLQEAFLRENVAGYAKVSFDTKEAFLRTTEDDEESVLKGIGNVVEWEGLSHHIVSVKRVEKGEDVEETEDAPTTDALRSVAKGVLEACPWLLFGAITTGILQSAQNSNALVRKYLGGRSIVEAALLGLVVPFCSCGAVPLALSLSDAGVSPDVVLAFLVSSQSAGIDSLPVTYGLLGPTAAMARLLGAIVLAVCAGLAVSSFSATPAQSKAVPSTASTVPKTSSHSFVGRALNVASSTVREIVPWLMAGVIFTEILAPRATEFRDALTDDSPISALFGRAALLGLALPLQACEHATASFSRALRAGGASPGVAASFLLVAPATNLATLAVVLRTSGSMAVARVATAIVLTGVGLGLLVDHVESLHDSLTLVDDGSLSGECLSSRARIVGAVGCAALLLYSAVTSHPPTGDRKLKST